MNIAIVGATGNVGRKTLEILERKEFSIDNLYLVASSKSVGVQIDLTKILLTSSLNIKNNDGNIIGELRSACYSPHFKKVIGIAMIKEPYCKASSSGTIEIDGNSLALKVCDLPFI